MTRHLARLAAAALVVVAAGVGVSSSADAATCGASSGVSVVVDFHQLRSGAAEAACDPDDGGAQAATLFTDVGHTLTYVDGEPFVCQVDGAPDTQCARTPPATAYWSLWWSDGTSGTWKYASAGVQSLHVPAGGYVALSWQKGSAQVPPRVKPKPHGASPPTSSPTTSPTTAPPSSRHTQAAASAPASSATSTAPVSPTTSPSAKSTHRHSAKPSASAGTHHSPSASASSSDQAVGSLAGVAAGGDGGGTGSGGIPGWLAPLAVAALFAVGGTVALVRRKSRGGA